ncbi:TonB-dependent receptor [Dysgonomonas sp. 521]|uniref:SusC/RagA family TonB-linked outer membrane protein n=1 Tax=Dysgonomonas sp. 521 TaxID=2302932 RepID=UPI0013D0F09B|nr:TonB-dependent receptor [Dysgonomonas sp. 521]NDV94386.1 TonB-dependent receptor [Dysgonomonas sp. 521]
MKDSNSKIYGKSAPASWRFVIVAFLCLLVALPASAQLRMIQGTVVDESQEPVIGATVSVNGSATRGTMTDIDGTFKIEASQDEKLTISFIGYQSVVVSADKTDLKITLVEDSKTLDEVVVVGYGTQKKVTLTGAVSAINNKEIVVTKNENVVNMLSGKIPGVRISQNSSAPGDFDNTIDIRGMSDKNNPPLIVVDGIPRDKAYFSRMDANEIESVSVLKDGTAAIYGVRAANGVILVTTKRGSASNGKFDITFSANFAWQQFLYVPETSSAADHMLLTNEKRYNDFNSNYPIRTTPQYTWQEMLEYSTGRKRSTNWNDELFKNNVPQSQYNISMDGGSDKVTYFFNLGYIKQEGSYRSGSLNYDRWNFRSNVDAQITKRLKASVQLSGYMDEKNQPLTDIWTVYKKAWSYRPTAEAWLDGDHSMPAFNDQMPVGGYMDNPVATTNSDFTGFRREKRNNFNGALTLTYDIPYVEGLNAKAFYSYDYYATNNTEYRRTYNLYERLGDGTINNRIQNGGSDSYLRRRTDPAYGTVMQLSLNYARKFGDHNVGALLLFEEQYNNNDNFYAQRNMLLDGEYLIYGEDEGQVAFSDKGGIWDETRQAIVGKVNYDYKGRYIADFAFRYDGSSRFPSDSRWGFFPTASLAWRISEEPFMKELVPFLNNLKLRGSYGRMGDDGIANHYPSTVVGYELNGRKLGWIYDGVLMGGLTPTAIPNPDLTWYISDTWDFGLDFDLWNSKLTGSFDVFKRYRSGLLETSSAVIPGTVGASMPQENINSDQTFGWEISLGHNNKIGDITYWVNGQISATKNRWDYKIAEPGQNSMENWRRWQTSGRNKDIWATYEEGGRFTSYDQIRYHNTTGGNYGQGSLPGDYWYKDWNGDGVINDQDHHPVATYNLPVFNYGITMGAAWKGVDFSMNWQGAAGVYNQYTEVFGEVGAFGGAILDIYQDRWHTVSPTDDPWNPNTQWEKGLYPATGRPFTSGTTGIQNTSYIRLKTLEVGYTLPKVWVSRVGIKNLRVYLNAYNLLTITGLDDIDPERPGAKGGGGNNNDEQGILFYNYPVNRTFNVGATIKF